MLPLKLQSFVCNSSKKLLVLPCSSQLLVNFSSSSSWRLSLSSIKDILSDENKLRVQEKISSVDPVRTTKELPLKDDFSSAAVLVPLCTVNGEPSILLTLRSNRLKNHRRQVSFPGGRVDETDPDLAFTALRETEEELGIHPSAFDVWGQMNPLPTYTRDTIVYPILARTGEVDVSQLRISEDEVEEVFTVTLENLCHSDNVGSTRFRAPSSYTIPVYTGASHRIWGLTAIIIHQVLTVIAPEWYKFKLRHKKYYSAKRK